MTNLFSLCHLLRIHKFIEENPLTSLLKTFKVPGCSIGIYTQNHRIFLNSGTRNGVNQISENTSFRIASLTKIVTSYVTHILINKKIIDLDTPLIEYFGKKYVDDERIYKITPRLILSHQTGFPN
jgi:CubicO group peptidase (beta-lactamase class C family)